MALGQLTKEFFGTSQLRDSYETFAKSHQLRDRSIDEKTLKDRLMALCPSAQYRRKLSAGNQNRGYDIPALPVARAEFATFIGGALEWTL